ncbi:MAG: NAD(P)/FAD-dependent oxidoreductase, partial [Syntrophomonadaceae bacterium]|nr:NAD(P)/FAD-dependent oxidoreductase [Syntrophomonadaceae bacterium]
RPELEKELAVSAGRDGAQIMMDTKFIDVVRENGKVAGVIIQQGEERATVPCKIVIGADGVYSRVAKRSQIKVPTDIMVSLGRDFVGVKRLVPVKEPFYELYMVPELAGYFCWVSPRGEDRMGVAIAFQPDLLKTGETAREIHDRFVRHLERIGRFDFSNAAEVSMMSGTTTAVKDAPDKLAEDGLMLVGDAAWRPLFVSNWGSPGIPTAVTSGRFAGETAAAAMKAGDVSENFLKVYEERLKATFEGSGITPESLVEARQLYFKLLSAAPEVQDAAVEAIGDQYSSLHLYLRGARPLAGCIVKIKELWEKNPQYN